MDFSYILGTLVSLSTLTLLEVVLGVDNLVFISILSNRLPVARQKVARRIGLMLALIMRLILLASVVWVVKLTKPLFHLFHFAVSGRDLFLFAGGLFLMVKGTLEIHNEFEEEVEAGGKKYAVFWAVILQIVLFDIVFSLDSILTAVGLTDRYWIMATAIIIAVILMLLASEPLSAFIHKHPTIKMLALSFLLLIGMVLVADAFHFHIPRAYIYFAIFFSVFVEFLNTLVASKRKTTR